MDRVSYAKLLRKNIDLENQIRVISQELFETNKDICELLKEFENRNCSKADNFEQYQFIDNLIKINKDQMQKLKNQENALLQMDKLAMIGQLVAGIVHEINNPNTYIRSNIELIKKYCEIIIQSNQVGNQVETCEKIDSIVRDILVTLDSMFEGTGRICNIISGLSFFTKNARLEFSKVDLYGCVKDLYVFIKDEINSEKIEFLNTLNRDEAYIFGSRQRIEQVILNLVINSIKAIRKKGMSNGKIEVYLKDVDSEFVTFAVSDNGCGISEGNTDRIFEPFFSTFIDDGGTGLGLSIVKSIIEEHEGKISVESKENIGTTFFITLKRYALNFG